MMARDLERLGQKPVMQDEGEALWEALRQVSDRLEDVRDAVELLCGQIEWLIVALPGQKVGRDKTARLTELDEARALVTLEEDGL